MCFNLVKVLQTLMLKLRVTSPLSPPSLSVCFFLLSHLCCTLRSGVVRHQSDDQAGLCEQEEGLHHGGGCDDVISMRLSQQEGVSREQQQSRRPAEAPAGCGVGEAEPLRAGQQHEVQNDTQCESYK